MELEANNNMDKHENTERSLHRDTIDTRGKSNSFRKSHSLFDLQAGSPFSFS